MRARIIFTLVVTTLAFVLMIGAMAIATVLFGGAFDWTPLELAGVWGMIFMLYWIFGPSILRTGQAPPNEAVEAVRRQAERRGYGRADNDEPVRIVR